MSLWLLIALLTCSVAALIARPLLKPPGGALTRADYDARVYADQLREVTREATRGVLSAEDAEAARREISRRLFELEGERDQPVAANSQPWERRTALALAVLAPLLAILMYQQLGKPALPDQPSAMRAPGTEADEAAGLAKILKELGERLRQEPADLDAWVALGLTLAAAGKPVEAAEALRWASRISGGQPDLVAYYGEALVRVAGGTVTEQAIEAFLDANAADPTEPRARYYLALADHQSGRREEALAAWQKMAAESPADAPWRAAVEARIRQVARELGKEPEALIPPPAPGDATPPLAEVLNSPTVQAMVKRLAERLEGTPGDVEGWLRLGRSYAVLGEKDKSLAAYGRAVTAAPERADAIDAFGAALIGAGAGFPPEYLAALTRRQAADAKDATALWYLGHAAKLQGRNDEARALWLQLKPLLPPNDPRSAELARALDALKPGP
ncbi:MAG: c-type cytochrome biogenesis protein CcmI [Alphaproteobacteria bacterium]|nr:c-type cytochrome biogenesis protein CcmI [Alphaproteobacteria bacterium]